MDFYAFEDFPGSKVTVVEGEDRDIVSDIYEFVGYVFGVCSESADELRRVFPDKEANSQNMTPIFRFD